MLKTVKGKVVAGTVAFGLLSGIGVVFGATDAGTNLKNWYNAQFGNSSNQIVEEVSDYGLGKIDGLVAEYDGLKADATNRINDAGKVGTDATNKNVDNRAGEHIDAIKQQKIEIENHLSDQFQSLRDFAAGLINETGQAALDYANEDLKNHANAVGSETKDKMTKDINANTAKAINDLEETIKYAKEELQAQLDSNINLTIEEIKDLIDAKISELRGKITKLNNSLIAEQNKIITMTAKNLLLKAEKELQDIVDGINK